MGRLVYSKVLICHEEAVCWQAVNHVTSREQYAERQDTDVIKGCYVLLRTERESFIFKKQAFTLNIL